MLCLQMQFLIFTKSFTKFTWLPNFGKILFLYRRIHRQLIEIMTDGGKFYFLKKNPVKMNTKWKKNIYLENLNSNYIKSLFAIKQLVNTVGKLFELHVVDDIQAFINYNFSCKRFRAHKTVLRARPCTWEIAHVINNTWYGDRNCTKLVLKPLAAKNGLSVSVLCIAPFLKIILFQYILWPPSIFAACTLHDLFT